MRTPNTIYSDMDSTTTCFSLVWTPALGWMETCLVFWEFLTLSRSGGSVDKQPPTAAWRSSWAAQCEASGNKRFHATSVVWYVSNFIDSERRGGQTVSSHWGLGWGATGGEGCFLGLSRRWSCVKSTFVSPWAFTHKKEVSCFYR